MHLSQHASLSARLPLSLNLLHYLFIIISLLLKVSAESADPLEQLQHLGQQHDLQTENPALYHESLGNGAGYEADFWGLDRSVVGRASSGSTSLGNNAPANLDIGPGLTDYYVFSYSDTIERRSSDASPSDVSTQEQEELIINETTNDEHDQLHRGTTDEKSLSPRQDANVKTVYVSMNVCQQPSFKTTNDIKEPPQLSLFISTSPQNTRPGPASSGSQTNFPLVEGFIGLELNITSNVYLAVHAPNATIVADILWNYELAASRDAPYHSFNSSQPFLYLVDSDQRAALLVTQTLASSGLPHKSRAQWMEAGPPFSIFVKQSNDTALNGLKHSFCALKLKAPLQETNVGGGSNNIQMGITERGVTKAAKQEIYVPYLNGSSTYDGFLAIFGNSTNAGGGVIGGGGTVFPSMNFTTKADGNCAVIYNLTFCDQVAYAVPSNPYHYSSTQLSTLYDNDAVNLYQNFSYSLQQIACNTTSTAQYSLARDCDNCAAAYKTWLCAVTIPRCADWTSPAAADSYLKPRNVAQAPFGGSNVPVITNKALLDNVAANSSRNNYTIVGLVQPGPYKEVLPCENLCYDLIQSCPSALGFACPLSGLGLEDSYGRSGTAPNGAVTCSAPGAVYYANSAQRLGLGTIALWCWVALVASLHVLR